MFYSFSPEHFKQFKKLLYRIQCYLLAIFIFWVLASCHLDNNDENHDINLFQNANNHWTIVNVWAVWCSPCLEEIPELNKLHHEGDVKVFGVDYDDSAGEELRKKIEELNIQFPIKGKSILTTFKIGMPKVLPVTYIFSPDGKLVNEMLGNQTSKSIKHRINTIAEKNTVDL